MRARMLAIAAVAGLVAAGSVSAAVTAKRVFGSVGPGFTITFGPKKLAPGKYTFVIRDKATSHNWHLKGPGTNKDLTSVGGTGTKSVTVTLKKGKYTFYCVPHSSSLRGTFKVA